MVKKKKIEKLEDLPGVGSATIEKLNLAGIDTLLSLAVTPPAELSEITGFSEGQSRKLIKLARTSLDMGFTNALEREKEDKKIFKISTNSKDFDKILDGGVESGSITEVYGEFGVSKSQLAHQLAVNAVKQFPDKYVVYIDTENSFKTKRLRQMIKNNNLNEDDVLKHILVTKAYNFDHQLFLVEKIEELLKNKKISLIVIDSLTNHLRAEYTGRGMLAERQQKLNRYIHKLGKIADIHNIVVFVTNQVMSNPGTFFGDPTKPVGGNVLGHGVKYRIYLRRGKGGTRVAKLVDSPHLPDADCSFIVTENGIGDVE